MGENINYLIIIKTPVGILKLVMKTFSIFDHFLGNNTQTENPVQNCTVTTYRLQFLSISPNIVKLHIT